MYVYQQLERGVWTVGFYKQDGTWVAESDHESAHEAKAQVNYLNGGARPTCNMGPR